MKQWTDIPLEMKEEIVQRCTEKTRNSLRAASFCNKQMVEWARVNSIDWLTILQMSEENLEMNFHIPAHKIIRYEKKYGSFEDLQQALTAILKSTHCIKKLQISNVSSNLKLDNWKNGHRQRLRVERLEVYRSSGVQIKTVLSQIEPVYLRQVTLYSDGADSTIYDMPQIIFAEKVFVGPSIREDQLMKLRARHVSFSRRTTFPLQNFIEKCISTTDINLLGFVSYDSSAHSELKRIYSPNSDNVLLDTSNPRLKFELKFHDGNFSPYVTGSIRYKSEKIASNFLYRDKSVLRVIDELIINYYPVSNNWKIKVLREFHHTCTYDFTSIEEFQTKLDEILENTDCISYLQVYGPAPAELDKISKIGMQWKPRKSKLMIKSVLVNGNHSITSIHDLMKQVDPVCLKVFAVESEGTDDSIFDIPHVYSTDTIEIKGSTLRDDILLKINAKFFGSGDYYRETNHNELLTAAAINQYIKKFLLNLDEMDSRGFRLLHLSPVIDDAEVLEGLNIVSVEEYEHGKTVVIDSAHPEYFLELRYLGEGIFGYRKKRNSESIFG